MARAAISIASALGDQFAGPATGDADAEDTVGVGVDYSSYPIVSILSRGAAEAAHGKRAILTARPSLAFLGERIRLFRSVQFTLGMALGSKISLSWPAMISALRPMMRSGVSQSSADEVTDGENRRFSCSSGYRLDVVAFIDGDGSVLQADVFAIGIRPTESRILS